MKNLKNLMKKSQKICTHIAITFCNEFDKITCFAVISPKIIQFVYVNLRNGNFYHFSFMFIRYSPYSI